MRRRKSAAVLLIIFAVCSIFMIPNERFLNNLQFWQRQTLHAFDTHADFIILEWARRHWKTTTILNILIREACKYPESIYTHLFPYFREAREAVWDDPKMLEAALPDKREMGWRKHEQKSHIVFANGSLYRLAGADRPDTMRGPDSDGTGFDEWSQMKESVWTEIYMPILAGRKHSKNNRRNRFAIFGYTPKGINHATRMFDWAACLDERGQTLPDCGAAKKCRPKWFASRVINDRTNFLSDEFLDMAAEQWPRAIRDQEINCARVTAEERVLITSAMLEEAKLYDIIFPKTKKIVTADPSLGGDACPIHYIENYQIKDRLVLHERNPMIITGEMIAMMTKHDCDEAVVDATGITIGKAIAARMREQGHKCYAFGSSEKATDEKKYVNRKAEAWMEVCQMVQGHKIPYIEDQQTREDISAVRYKTTDSRGRFQLEDKEDTKKRLGRSPDDGDTFVQGCWRMKRIEYVQDKKRKNRDKYEKKKRQSVWTS